MEGGNGGGGKEDRSWVLGDVDNGDLPVKI